jgi:hypothetical protein
MVALIAILLFALPVIFFVRRGYRPSLVLMGLVLANIVSFYLIEYIKLDGSMILRHSYKFKRSYLDADLPVLLMFGLLMISIVLPALLASRRYTTFEANIGVRDSVAIDRFMIVYLVAITLLCCVHAIASNLAFLSPYTAYLSLRGPEMLSIRIAPLDIFHMNIGTFGIVQSFILFYMLQRRNALGIALVLIGFSYMALFQAASLSRWLVLQLVIPPLLSVISGRKMRVGIPAMIAVGLAMPVYYSIMSSRSNFELGIGSLIDNVVAIPRWSAEFFVSTAANIFGGGLVIAEAGLKQAVSYPGIYKALSFSPLPSAIDGFAGILHHQQRINIYGPFNAFAEAYWFGWPWTVLLFLIVGGVVYLNDRLEATVTSSSLAGRLLVRLPNLLLFYGVLLMTQYPLRNSLRWVLFSGIACLLGLIYMRVQRRRAAAGADRGASFRPPAPRSGRTGRWEPVTGALRPPPGR